MNLIHIYNKCNIFNMALTSASFIENSRCVLLHNGHNLQLHYLNKINRNVCTFAISNPPQCQGVWTRVFMDDMSKLVTYRWTNSTLSWVHTPCHCNGSEIASEPSNTENANMKHPERNKENENKSYNIFWILLHDGM